MLDGQTSRELKAVVVEAKSEQPYQYTSSPAINVAEEVFAGAETGHVIAIESQAELGPMWLVRVVRKHDSVRRDQHFEDWGVQYCVEKGTGALEVTRMFVSSSHLRTTTAMMFYEDGSLCR